MRNGRAGRDDAAEDMGVAGQQHVAAAAGNGCRRLGGGHHPEGRRQADNEQADGGENVLFAHNSYRRGNGTTSCEVLPGSILTVCVAFRPPSSSTTVCVPAERFGIVAGVVPRGSPSIITRAPEGSLLIDSDPVTFASCSSMNCEVCTPALIVSGITRGSSLPTCTSSTCGPAGRRTVAGVTPTSL